MAGGFAIASWNINSVRLRLPIVLRYLAEAAPDVLCLQETKCPDDRFPAEAFRKAGYAHLAHRGAKGYNGVAIIARRPLSEVTSLSFCGRDDARHLSAIVDLGSSGPVAVQNFYVPAGGDVADPEANEKFAHKLGFLAEMDAWGRARASQPTPAILVGDLNVAPYEHDVWSHRQLLDVVSHTPIETQTLERLRLAGGWTDAVRTLIPEPEKVYTWWSYRAADWRASDRGRRLDHVWVSDALAPALRATAITRDARDWEKPSDHVPVLARLDL